MPVINIGFNLSGVTSLIKYFQQQKYIIGSGSKISQQIETNYQLNKPLLSGLESYSFLTNLYHLDATHKYGFINTGYNYYNILKKQYPNCIFIITYKSFDSLIHSMFCKTVNNVPMIEYINNDSLEFKLLIKTLDSSYKKYIEEIKQNLNNDHIIWFNIEQLDESLAILNKKMDWQKLTIFPKLNLSKIKIVSILVKTNDINTISNLIQYYKIYHFQVEIIILSEIKLDLSEQFYFECKTGFIQIITNIEFYQYKSNGHILYISNGDKLLNYIQLVSLINPHTIYWDNVQLALHKVNFKAIDLNNISDSLAMLTNHTPIEILTNINVTTQKLYKSIVLIEVNKDNYLNFNSIVYKEQNISIICHDDLTFNYFLQFSNSNIKIYRTNYTLDHMYSFFLSQYDIIYHIKSNLQINKLQILNQFILNHHIDYFTNETKDFIIIRSNIKTVTHFWNKNLDGMIGKFISLSKINQILDYKWYLWGNPILNINSQIGNIEMQTRQNLYEFGQQIVTQLSDINIPITQVIDKMPTFTPKSIIITFGIYCHNAKIPINQDFLYVIIRPNDDFAITKFPKNRTIVVANYKKTKYQTLIISKSFTVSELYIQIEQLNDCNFTSQPGQ